LRKNQYIIIHSDFEQLIDTKNKGQSWHSIEVFSDTPYNTSITIDVSISDIAESPSVLTVVNPTEFFVNKFRGRFLKLKINCTGNAKITKIKINLKVLLWTDFLPEVYSANNDFLSRFLYIFSKIYSDTEYKIDNMNRNFNCKTADFETVKALSKWLGEDYSESFGDDYFRWWVNNFRRINNLSGTYGIISEIINKYTDSHYKIIEFNNIKNELKNPELSELYKNLFSDDPYTFTVLINFKADKIFYKNLYNLIMKIKPAHMNLKFIILKEETALDRHSYLGINTFLK
jgi:phage tail-like protein